MYRSKIFSIIKKYKTNDGRRGYMQRDIENIIFENTPKIQELAHICETNTAIDKELYTKYEVKRGLRDLNGKGVLAGLTNISDIAINMATTRWKVKKHCCWNWRTIRGRSVNSCPIPIGILPNKPIQSINWNPSN